MCPASEARGPPSPTVSSRGSGEGPRPRYLLGARGRARAQIAHARAIGACCGSSYIHSSHTASPMSPSHVIWAIRHDKHIPHYVPVGGWGSPVGCFPPGGVFPCGVWGLPPSGSFVARCCLLSCLCVLCSLASRRLADLPAYNSS